MEKKDFYTGSEAFRHFAMLDDTDIYVALKYWMNAETGVLSFFRGLSVTGNCSALRWTNIRSAHPVLKRSLTKSESVFQIEDDFDMQYYVFHDSTSNSACTLENKNIKIKRKQGLVEDVTKVSDHLHLAALADTVVKHYLCYPKP